MLNILLGILFVSMITRLKSFSIFLNSIPNQTRSFFKTEGVCYFEKALSFSMVRKKDELYFPVCAECLYVVTSVSIIKIVVVDIQLSLIKDFEFVLLNLVSPMWISNIE